MEIEPVFTQALGNILLLVLALELLKKNGIQSLVHTVITVVLSVICISIEQSIVVIWNSHSSVKSCDTFAKAALKMFIWLLLLMIIVLVIIGVILVCFTI